VMQRLLERNPRLQLVCAGDDWSRHQRHIDAIPERVRVLNGFSTPLKELTGVHAAADIYVEGYPIGSQIALLEIASIGVPVVLAPHFGAPVMTTDDVALEGIVEHPADEDDYERNILALAADPALRLAQGDRLSEAVTRRHYEDFPLFAEVMYLQAEEHAHGVRAVPESRAEYSADDLAIASFHESNNTEREPLYAYTRQLRGALSARAMLQLRRRARQSQADASALRPWLTLLAEKTIKEPVRSAYRAWKNHDRH
jgi:hypothetical protein